MMETKRAADRNSVKDHDRNDRFYNDAVSNYLIIRCTQSALAGYTYRMLAANRINGILSCSLRNIDGETCLYYDVTGCESLSAEIGSSGISGEEVKRFLYGMTAMLASLSEFLLDDSHLLLEPDYIFHDFEQNDWRFTYYPEAQEKGGMQRLFQYLADRLDTSDPDSTAVLYHLCDMAGKPGFVLREDLLDREYEKLAPEREMEKRADWRDGGDVLDHGELDWAPDSVKEYYPDRGLSRRNRGDKDKSCHVEKKTPGGILALAVFFLVGAAGMEVSRFFIKMTEEQRTAVHAGMIASLVMALVTALYGTFYTYRRNRREIHEEEREKIERDRNAMTPSMEFECGMMDAADPVFHTERRE